MTKDDLAKMFKDPKNCDYKLNCSNDFCFDTEIENLPTMGIKTATRRNNQQQLIDKTENQFEMLNKNEL